MYRRLTFGLCITLCSFVPAGAATITVTSDSGGTGGLDCTLRDAITAANTDTATGGCTGGSGADVIELPDGVTITLTEEDNQTDGRNGLPSISSEITINGNDTTIQRHAGGDTPDFRLFHIAADGNLMLNDLTASGGSAQGKASPANAAGGILNYGESTLTDSNISDNTAAGGGGGIRNYGELTLTNSNVSDNTTSNSSGGGIRNYGWLALTDSNVSGNTAAGYGGGILNRDGGTVTLTNSIVSGNSAGRGGGIHNIFATVTMADSIVSGNFANSDGGGIVNAGDGTVTLTNSTVSGNSAGDIGGGIKLPPGSGDLILTNSTVKNNTAAWGGGIYNRSAGTATLTNSTVSDNTSVWAGGGIYTYTTLTLTNSIVSGNTAGSWGGGILKFTGTVTLTNSTISGNVGGGIFNYLSFGTVTLTNSIVANNTPTDCENLGALIDAGYNIIEDGTCISNPTSFGGDPMLGPLQDNGGPTLTHALLEGSPAIDAIPVVDCVVDTDQRGVLRPQGDGCDIGSYEVEVADPCADDDGDGRVTICHVPRGNAHTITVSVRALPAHLAHGDHCGPCADGLPASADGPVTGRVASVTAVTF